MNIRVLLLLLFIPSAHAFTILGTGTSNLGGRGIGGPSALTANPLVQVWNNTNDLGQNGDSFISVPAFGNPPWHSSGANNFPLWFADAAADSLNQPVNLVIVAKGSQSITKWRRNEVMYDELSQVYQLTELPPADVFIWNQGADIEMSACTYKLEFLALIARLRYDGIIAYDAVILVGDVRNSEAQHIATALSQLGSTHPEIKFVSDDGLPDFDGVHYTGQALHDFGLRYWERYSQ